MFPRTLIALALLLMACGPSVHVVAGDQHLAASNYRAALTSYETALAEDPDSEEIARKAELARGRYFDELSTQAREAQNRGDHIGALKTTRKAWELYPNSPKAQNLVDQTSQAVAYAAGKLREDQDYSTALLLHEVAMNELPAPNPHAEAAVEMRNAWEDDLRAQAEEARASGEPAAELLFVGKLAQLKNTADLDNKRLELLTQVLEEEKFLIDVKGEGFPDRIQADLTRLKQGALQVRTQVKEPDVRLKVSGKRPVFIESENEVWRSVTFQSGTRQVSNPSYKNRLNDLERAQRDVVDAENTVTRAEQEVTDYESRVSRESPEVSSSTKYGLERARRDLQGARDRLIRERDDVMRAREALNREPQTVEEPVYSEHQYAVKIHTLTAKIQVQLEFSGLHDEKKSIPLEVSVSDETHPPQPSMTGVGADPLTLPSDEALAEDLLADALAATNNEILRVFDEWREREAQKALDEPGTRRLDSLVRVLVRDLERADQRVAGEIKSLSGIPDAVSAIRGGR